MCGPLPMESKDWNERFHRADRKQRPLRVFFGFLILLGKTSFLLGIAAPNERPGLLGRLDLYSPAGLYAVSYDIASVRFWVLAAWLIVSSLRSHTAILPKDPE
jgi:hypothetical protein